MGRKPVGKRAEDRGVGAVTTMETTVNPLSRCDRCGARQEGVETYLHNKRTGEEKVVKYCLECHRLAQEGRMLDIEITSPPLS